MTQQHTLYIEGGVARNPLVRLSQPVTLDFLDGEHIAVVGPTRKMPQWCANCWAR